jgi:hypothetical protein
LWLPRIFVEPNHDVSRLKYYIHTEGLVCFPSVPLDECEVLFDVAAPKANARVGLEVKFRTLTPLNQRQYIDVNLGGFSAPDKEDIAFQTLEIGPATGDLAFALPSELPKFQKLGCWTELRNNR